MSQGIEGYVRALEKRVEELEQTVRVLTCRHQWSYVDKMSSPPIRTRTCALCACTETYVEPRKGGWQ